MHFVLQLTGAALEENPELRSKADENKMNRIFTHVDALANADYTTEWVHLAYANLPFTFQSTTQYFEEQLLLLFSSKVKVLFRRVLQLRKNLWQSPENPNFANVASAASSAAAATTLTKDSSLNYVSYLTPSALFVTLIL